MSNYQGNREVIYVERPSNTLGTAAFVLSLVAFISIGCLSPVSLVLSIMAMQRQPKDMAVAGLVLSLIGCIPAALLAAWLVAIAVGTASLGAAMVDDAPGPAVGEVEKSVDSEKPKPKPVVRKEPLTGTVRNVRVEPAQLGGTRMSFDLTNTSSDTMTNVEVEINFVDSVNDEVVAKGTLKTRLEPPLKAGEKQQVKLRVPHDSPLNTGVPSTCVGRGVVIDAD